MYIGIYLYFGPFYAYFFKPAVPVMPKGKTPGNRLPGACRLRAGTVLNPNPFPNFKHFYHTEGTMAPNDAFSAHTVAQSHGHRPAPPLGPHPHGFTPSTSMQRDALAPHPKILLRVLAMKCSSS